MGALLVVLAMLRASFWAGGHIEHQKNQTAREQICLNFISFARDKAEKGDLSDDFTMEALISEVYAAWCYCSKGTVVDGQLHDLWNDLMRDGEKYIGEEDILIAQLDAISESIRMKRE